MNVFQHKPWLYLIVGLVIGLLVALGVLQSGQLPLNVNAVSIERKASDDQEQTTLTRSSKPPMDELLANDYSVDPSSADTVLLEPTVFSAPGNIRYRLTNAYSLPVRLKNQPSLVLSYGPRDPIQVTSQFSLSPLQAEPLRIWLLRVPEDMRLPTRPSSDGGSTPFYSFPNEYWKRGKVLGYLEFSFGTASVGAQVGPYRNLGLPVTVRNNTPYNFITNNADETGVSQLMPKLGFRLFREQSKNPFHPAQTVLFAETSIASNRKAWETMLDEIHSSSAPPADDASFETKAILQSGDTVSVEVEGGGMVPGEETETDGNVDLKAKDWAIQVELFGDPRIRDHDNDPSTPGELIQYSYFLGATTLNRDFDPNAPLQLDDGRTVFSAGVLSEQVREKVLQDPQSFAVKDTIDMGNIGLGPGGSVEVIREQSDAEYTRIFWRVPVKVTNHSEQPFLLPVDMFGARAFSTNDSARTLMIELIDPYRNPKLYETSVPLFTSSGYVNHELPTGVTVAPGESATVHLILNASVGVPLSGGSSNRSSESKAPLGPGDQPRSDEMDPTVQPDWSQYELRIAVGLPYNTPSTTIPDVLSFGALQFDIPYTPTPTGR